MTLASPGAGPWSTRSRAKRITEENLLRQRYEIRLASIGKWTRGAVGCGAKNVFAPPVLAYVRNGMGLGAGALGAPAIEVRKEI